MKPKSSPCEKAEHKEGTMKFTEMRYVRPDMDRVLADFDKVAEEIADAKSAAAQIAAYERADTLREHFSTAASLACVRYTIDTRDAFYAAENDFMDAATPLVEEKIQNISKEMLSSPYRKELEAHFGALFFRNLEISARTFKPEIIALMQEENALVSEYQALDASMTVEFDGKTLPLTKLIPYMKSTDRATRRAAYTVEGECYDSHREALDSLFDKLVRNRTAQARALGYENYIGLGYILAPKYWKKGYATQGAAILLNRAFRELGAQLVIAEIRPENTASRRVAERLGMKCTGEFLKYYRGKQMPHLIYRITKNEFCTLKTAVE